MFKLKPEQKIIIAILAFVAAIFIVVQLFLFENSGADVSTVVESNNTAAEQSLVEDDVIDLKCCKMICH